MFFPRQHPERDVVVVLQAGEVGLLSVPSADVRSAAKGGILVLPDRGDLGVVSGVETACEGLCDVVTAPCEHALLEPRRVAATLNDLIDFLHGPLDWITPPSSSNRAGQFGQGALRVFEQAIEVPSQALRRVFVGVLRAPHPNPLALFAGELDLGCTCHRSASVHGGWRVE